MMLKMLYTAVNLMRETGRRGGGGGVVLLGFRFAVARGSCNTVICLWRFSQSYITYVPSSVFAMPFFVA